MHEFLKIPQVRLSVSRCRLRERAVRVQQMLPRCQQLSVDGRVRAESVCGLGGLSATTKFPLNAQQ